MSVRCLEVFVFFLHVLIQRTFFFGGGGDGFFQLMRF